jgi:hypothetical protein
MKTEKDIIYGFVDKSLQILQALDLMKLPHPDMPEEMIDKTRKGNKDWIPWKAVPSRVTNEDIKELENRIGLKYPDLYVEFLKYRHFYELNNLKEITFHRHCIRDWKQELVNMYFHSWKPDQIIGEGYIPFANYSDWGIICFDTNTTADRSRYPIVMIDHEVLYDEPVPKEKLYSSFIEMIKDLNETQEKEQKIGA